MRVLVTGAAGQLGRVIAGRADPADSVAAFTRQQLDITNRDVVQRAVRDAHPDAVINCAAFNDVDGAQDRPVEAFAANALGVAELARAAAEAGAVFVHYSSDFVFDGESDRPYVETDPPNPQSHYALSKLLGEWLAADAPAHYVLRVESLFGGERAKSSVDRIGHALRRGERVRVFADRTVTPSFVVDVAAATRALLERRPPAGLYHCVNTGVTTWLGIATEAARLLGADPALLEPVSVRDVPMKAARPQYCALSNQKLADAGIRLPEWQDALARHLRV